MNIETDDMLKSSRLFERERHMIIQNDEKHSKKLQSFSRTIGSVEVTGGEFKMRYRIREFSFLYWLKMISIIALGYAFIVMWAM